MNMTSISSRLLILIFPMLILPPGMIPSAVYIFFTIQTFLPEYRVSKLLLDSAHDAMPTYDYCRRNHIVLFVGLNIKQGRTPLLKK